MIKKSGGSLLNQIEVFDIYYGENIGKDKKSISYSLSFGDRDRTLTEEEINNIMEKIIANLENKLKAEIRKS